MGERIAVLIPALDEEQTIAKVVRDFKKELPDAAVYVFDNGSSDRTAAEAKAAGAIVKIFKKRGKGHAIKKMFDHIDADFYVVVDADDTYPAEQVHELLEPVIHDEADMVIGSRMSNFQKEEKKWLHNIGNRIIRASVNFCFNTKINDMLSGYRAMSREFVKNIHLLSKGFEIETELTIKALENGYRIKEIPIQYRKRPAGSKSKLNTVHDGMYILTTTLNLFRDYRPMQFFLLMSFLSMAISVGFGTPVIVEFINTQKITKIYSFAFSVLFFLISFQLFVTGFIGSAVHRAKEELMNVLNKIKKTKMED